MKIISVVGARPEFIQATPVSRALRKHHREILVHTGQHYDYKMSQTFFDELGIPAPDYNLEVGSGSHAGQTAEILVRFEEIVLKEQPEVIIVRGDTNSTLAGALVASKLHIPTVHIEAGERSFDRRMPEEINRLVADQLSSAYFCVSQTAVRQLANEGITKNVYWVGDVMLDANLANRPLARKKSTVLSDLGLAPASYSLVTVHRAANTDDPARLTNIVHALSQVGETVIFPVHPRTRGALEKLDAQFGDNVRLIEPVGYYDMMVLEENARLIATDSGGVQREAYFMQKPCLTLRDETEWTETVTAGWNKLVGVDVDTIVHEWNSFTPPSVQPPIFGDGTAGEKIAETLGQIQLSVHEDRVLA
ncbi:MAG TPA: UDP-N-acetylglucosamine 2-epimerase (non-hydrolyzing) [Anaerolineales bacterium]|nr:UDP-N-acetylglucosamine 2-epimerase (non-hydrolyzing) [Anaerolineales bacterium]HNQ94345.1 UDP-N-acetylglucosamine 2-epimerase (non-hydrolyzing) [Anaerolineales bacterium]HNS60277.1 UDP-N-acetylglucosamine 2-epimerase (non-hydrolyzing) [Anaerolineales bacterium]